MQKANSASVINAIKSNPAGYGILMAASFAQFAGWGGKYDSETQSIMTGLLFSPEVMDILGVAPNTWQYINTHSRNQEVADAAKDSMHLLSADSVQVQAFQYLDHILDFMRQQSNPLKLPYTQEAIHFISQVNGLNYDYNRPGKNDFEYVPNQASYDRKEILFPNLSFSQKTEATVNNEFLLPVPDGFKFSGDQDMIGGNRLLTIIPNDYFFSDDPMEASVALSIQSVVIPCGRRFEPDLVSIYGEVFTHTVNILQDGVEITSVNPRSGCGFIFQNMNSYDDPSWNKILGLIFANENAYITHIIFNHPEGNSADSTLIESFVSGVKNWLSQIHLIEEDKPKIFPESTPDVTLYPHYQQMLDAAQSIPGIKVVVNSSGTEYEYIPLEKALSEDTALADRISRSDSGANTYPLAKAARNYSQLFHVAQEYFNPSRDRECEINAGYLHRAYMFSALRSFGWTVSGYCDEQNLNPGDLTCNTLRNLVAFIAQKNWLNYDGVSYCRALCSGNDLHVFYVPTSIAENDFRDLLHLVDEPENSAFPNTVPCTVSSLDALRADLAYLQPAIETLQTYLQSNRSSCSEQLTGNEADIVYAWCSLALAAQKPFFVEDGPMRCFFSFPEEKYQRNDHVCSDDSDNNSEDPLDSPVYPPDFVVREDGVMEEYKGSDKEVIIPEGITDVRGFFGNETVETVILPRTASVIGYCAFYGCTALKNIIIQSEISRIGDSAFYDCTSLEHIELPNTVTSIEQNAFCNCASLKCIELPSTVTSIRESAFYHCSSLEELILPEGLQEICKNTFSGCESLKYIEIPNTVTVIGEGAFFYCISLKNIKLPSNLKVLGQEAFYICTNLQSVSIPGSLEIIEKSTFDSCNNLTSVEIQEGVKRIREKAFALSDLKTILLPASLNFISKYAFFHCTYHNTINCMVESGSYAATYVESVPFLCPIYLDSSTAPEY